MGLETTFNFIDDFNVTWPNSSPDTLAQADDHMRGIKKATIGSFPNLGQNAVVKTAVQINDLATVSGTETLDGKTINDGLYTGTQTGFVGDITGSVIGTGVITNTNLAANSVTSSKIAGNAVGSTEIASGAVGSSEIAPDAVGSSEIAPNAVRFSSEIDADTATGSTNVSSQSSVTIARGVWVIYCSGADISLRCNVNGTTRTIAVTGETETVTSNGSNITVANTHLSNTQSFDYRKMYL